MKLENTLTRASVLKGLRPVTSLLLAAALLAVLHLLVSQSVALAGWEDPVFVSQDGNQTGIVISGDLNGDGALDLVTGNPGDKPSAIYLNKNDGSGLFEKGATFSGTALALGDMNGDGTLDIIAHDSILKVYLNAGNGNVMSSISLADSSQAGVIAIGDVDRNGALDIVATGFYVPSVVFFNNYDGTFTRGHELSNSGSTYSIALGDVNGDQAVDIVLGQAFSHTLPLSADIVYAHTRIYLNDTRGGFVESAPLTRVIPQSYNPGNMSPTEDWNTEVELGDVGGDGGSALDVLAMEKKLGGKVYMNNGKGGFDEGQDIPDTVGLLRVAVGDVNSDASLDIVGYSSLSNRMFVYGNSNGGFVQNASLRVLLPNSWWATVDGLTLGDVNNDGTLDIIFGGIVDQPTAIYQNDGAGGFDLGQPSNHLPDDNYNLCDPLSLVRCYDYDPGAVALGDLDNNGTLDMVQSTVMDQQTWGAVAVLLNFHKDGCEAVRYLKHPAAPYHSGPDFDGVTRLAVGDLNSDGALDIVQAVYDPPNLVYPEGATPSEGYLTVFLNARDGCGAFAQGSFIDGVKRNTNTTSVAIGDVDGDRDLDIIGGSNGGPSAIYLNRNDMPGSFQLGSELTDLNRVRDLALGDVNGDGALDIVAVNYVFQPPAPQPVTIYLNRGDGSGSFYKGSNVISKAAVQSVALGDLDSDGDVDIVIGSRGYPIRVLLNNGVGVFDASVEVSGAGSAQSVTLGDVNGDGALDIAATDSERTFVLFLNQGDARFTRGFGPLPSQRLYNPSSVAVGDFYGDGSLDVVVTGDEDPFKGFNTAVYPNLRQVFGLTVNSASRMAVKHPVSTGKADFYSSPIVLDTPSIPVTYTLFDADIDPVGRVGVSYSYNGGGQWRTAFGDIPTNRSTSPYPTTNVTNTHGFSWDILQSGFFGQSDNVVLRFVAYAQSNKADTPGSYRYYDSVAGTYQWASTSATTFPFRASGTRVRVYKESLAIDNKLSDASVFRLKKDYETGAELMPDPDKPLSTDYQGFLPGAGELAKGDKLFAIWPAPDTEQIPFSDTVKLYYTSGQPTSEGLTLQEVLNPGVQELVIKKENKLLLLNLDVSLEWDARNDGDYLVQLTRDITRTSEILFDLTNGQMALGDVRVYQAGEKWVESDIRIYARNDLAPNANLGGIVSQPISDTITNTIGISRVVPNAMVPGQIRMGATWNRYGDPEGTIGEDWPRALAHEIGHYALFLLDNYVGKEDKSGLLIPTDCMGSAMTDAYREDYSEFLDRNLPPGDNNYRWTGDCDQTLAAKTTGRSDWETILLKDFYPFLKQNFDKTAKGPARLPINVTNVVPMPVARDEATMVTPFVYTVDKDGKALALKTGEAQAYLFKAHLPGPSDDEAIALGTPVGPLVQARGAAVGDQLCVFKPLQEGTLLGCEPIAQTVALHEFPDWQPQIDVSAVTSTTLAFTVTQAGLTEAPYVQIYPTYRPTSTVTAVSEQLSPVAGTDMFTHTFAFSLTVASGHVRVWMNEPEPRREAVSEFFLSLGWNGNSFRAFGSDHIIAWDGNSFRAFGGNDVAGFPGNSFRAFGGNSFRAFGAPTTSGDGRLMIFNLENILEGNVASILESLTVPPDIPPWLTPVGPVYRYKPAEPVTATLIMQYQYLQRELPNVREDQLRLYYSPDEGKTWKRIEETVLDDYGNLASAAMVRENGEVKPGIYALMATIAAPGLSPGWNLFAYPDTNTRAVPDALASIDHRYNPGLQYTSVYKYDRATPPATWLLYDQLVEMQHPEFSTLVNDLKEMKPLESYWIYALADTVPYIGVPKPEASSAPASIDLPPGTFYGWVNPTDGFIPQPGDQVKALINGVVCGVGKVVDLPVGAGESPTQPLPKNKVFLPLVFQQTGRLAYKVQVMADSGNNCGVPGREVTFMIGEKVMPNSHPWGNSQACFHPLGPPSVSPSPCFMFTAPDLIVEQILATPNNVSVKIKNIGTEAVAAGTGFWVDAYIDPPVPPRRVNDIWEDFASQGLAWAVTGVGLPLEPGASLTLSIGDAYYVAQKSRFAGSMRPGTPIYAQVDSASESNWYGGVWERHEMFGPAYNELHYNNVSDPTPSGAAVEGTGGDLNLDAVPSEPLHMEGLPPRPGSWCLERQGEVCNDQ
jgi:hypothetical protein